MFDSQVSAASIYNVVAWWPLTCSRHNAKYTSECLKLFLIYLFSNTHKARTVGSSQGEQNVCVKRRQSVFRGDKFGHKIDQYRTFPSNSHFNFLSADLQRLSALRLKDF